jgi:uncharacterized protein YcsI (UPF0317 family)
MSIVNPPTFRASCRQGEFTSQTSGQCSGFAQANLCILPKKYAYDFLLFCTRNPKPCPLLHVLEEGQFQFGQDIDVRSDLPKYRVYENGILKSEEPTNIESLWRSDYVTFVIGCSFSFEEAMTRAGLPLRHVETQRNVPMYNTSIACAPAGCFSGNMVVSMRPMTPAQALKAVEITARYPRVHGSPIHLGSPSDIGIFDIDKPDYGEAVEIRPGEIPVFWACGVTPQAIVMKSKPSICITHAPGCMLVLDTRNDELSLC